MAAALYELWTSAAGAAAPAALPDIPATARIYVGVGKKDGATVNDLVAVLTKEVRVERTKIGRVELRDGSRWWSSRPRTPSGSRARSTARRSGGGG